MNLKIGDTIGDYEIAAVLGAGGMGQVYKVQNTLSNRMEAMKVVLPSLLESPEQSERFLREIRLQASLDHPNIATLHTALRQGDQILMVMELVEGTSLQALLEKRPLSIQEAVGFTLQALSALAYAHERGIVHRDIKPANIMLTREGTVKLMDFGIARLVQDRKLTVSGATVGSLFYMSPEQILGNADIDHRSDLYSLGVTLYECVTGQRPFQGESDYVILSAHLSQAPPVPRDVKPDIPEDLNRVILKSLAKNRDERFQTAQEFHDALQKFSGLSDSAVSPKPLGASDFLATQPMQSIVKPAPAAAQDSSTGLEMAFVLFMDIVGYSKLAMDLQSRYITQLVNIVKGTAEYRRAAQNDQIISLPTGDGMALVFFQNPVAPIQCATEISKALKNQPHLQLRMGVHTGPVYRIADINTNRNVAGGGINLAQRVMDCGDSGHILLSRTVADVLGQLSDWSTHLHDLGEAEVKHGVKVQVVNFYNGDTGNPDLPLKLRATQPHAALAPLPPPPVYTPEPVVPQPSSRNNLALGGGIAAVLLVLVGGFFMFRGGSSSAQDGNISPASLAPSSPSQATTPPQPPNTPPPNSTDPPTVLPAGAPPPIPSSAASKASPAQAQKPPSAQRAVVTEPPQSASAPASSAPAPQAAPPPPPPAAAAQAPTANTANRAEVQQLRERMILMAARAGAVRSSLENMERDQNRRGLGMRRDIATASQSLLFLMGDANEALTAGDTDRATRDLDLAERSLETVEKFLGR